MNGISHLFTVKPPDLPIDDAVLNEGNCCVGTVTMGEWKNGLFGCFDNIGLCLLTSFCSCYTFGKIAEATGRSCCTWGCIYVMVPGCTFCLGNWIPGCYIRGSIRESKGIEGSGVIDALLHCFCGCCSLIQEAREMGAMGYSMAGDGSQVMERA